MRWSQTPFQSAGLCCSPALVRPCVIQGVKIICNSQASSTRDSSRRSFPCARSPHFWWESREPVGLLELLWWHTTVGSSTNHHLAGDKSGGGKKRWSLNEFLMKANDSYINQAASLKGEVGWTGRWQRLTPHSWHQTLGHFSWALTRIALAAVPVTIPSSSGSTGISHATFHSIKSSLNVSRNPQSCFGQRWKDLLFFSCAHLMSSQFCHGSWSGCSPAPGTTPASADVCAVLWACASLWTAVLHHPCVFSCCSSTDLCLPYSVAAVVSAQLPMCERCFQDQPPTSGHPLPTLHSPGCLSDSVLAVSKTAIWILADFTNLCIVNTQREVVGCPQGWMSLPSCCHLVCECGVVLCALGVCDQWWGSQLLWEQKKAQGGFDHADTNLNNFLEPLQLMKMWQQRTDTSSWPHMAVPPADLCSRVQHPSLLIYSHLEQKQGRQGKAAPAPTHHMLFLMIENGVCTVLS